MKRLSVEDSFLWVQRFVAREWRLLLPLTVAFLALPPLLLDLFAPKSMIAMMGTPDGSVPPDIGGMLRILPATLLVTLIGFGGSLSIIALALVPRISVREAIVQGFRRLPVAVAIGVLMFFLLLAVAIAGAILLMIARLPFAAQQGVLMGLLLGVGIVLWVRLVMLAPLLIERRLSPIAAIRLGWEQSRGHFWRLLLAMLIYMIGAFVIILALWSSLGAILLLFGRMIGTPELGTLLSLILFRTIAAFGSAGLQLLAVAFYRQLGSRSGI